MNWTSRPILRGPRVRGGETSTQHEWKFQDPWPPRAGGRGTDPDPYEKHYFVAPACGGERYMKQV